MTRLINADAHFLVSIGISMFFSLVPAFKCLFTLIVLVCMHNRDSGQPGLLPSSI